jgi:CcmD family protein
MTITTTMTKIMMKIMTTKIMMLTMKMKRLHATVGALALLVALLIAPATAIAQQSPAPTPQPPAATDQFVPIDEIPEQDKLPAAPYLISAYAIAWLALLFYVWSLWRRLQRVEDELKRLTPGSSVSDH